MSTSTDVSQLADEFGELVRQVRYLTRTRVHKISSRQVDTLDKLSERSLVAMKVYLERQLERQPADQQAAAQAGAITAQIHQASEGAVPASRELHAGPGAHRAPGQRPGPKVTEPGIYYFEKRVYKVIKSQYSGHLQARRLNPEARTDKWTYIPGMMGILRAGDKMTAEDSREFEELYGYPTCTDCGAPLENDLSRERRVGPVCWGKNGH